MWLCLVHRSIPKQVAAAAVFSSVLGSLAASGNAVAASELAQVADDNRLALLAFPVVIALGWVAFK